MNHRKKKLVLAIALAYNLPLAMAGQPKTDICHYNDEGFKNLITIPAKAANKHIRNHGDNVPEFRFRDADGDGFGDAGAYIETCDEEDGFVADDTDLDDTDPGITDMAPPPPPPPTSAPTMAPQGPPSYAGSPTMAPQGPPPSSPTMAPPGPPSYWGSPTSPPGAPPGY